MSMLFLIKSENLNLHPISKSYLAIGSDISCVGVNRGSKVVYLPVAVDMAP